MGDKSRALRTWKWDYHVDIEIVVDLVRPDC